MEQKNIDGIRERSRRPIRNKRYNRRPYAEERRPPKRLFTPEIKRFLKDWLIRRRDNPYPNRDEKKSLAIQTGLTYIQGELSSLFSTGMSETGRTTTIVKLGKICSLMGLIQAALDEKLEQGKPFLDVESPYQIRSKSAKSRPRPLLVCNWFANWRRKLKNAGKEPQRKTWGHLIKTYNNQVHGNVEHFSISSDDSIWQEPDNVETDSTHTRINHKLDSLQPFSSPENSSIFQNLEYNLKSMSFQQNSTHNKRYSDNDHQNGYDNDLECNPFSQHANKYKSHIMEKYLRDCQKPENYCESEDDGAKPSMISKWLESAANFRPSENNYLNWTLSKTQKKKIKKSVRDENVNNIYQQHGREELDAAEALTRLANAHANLKL